MDATRLRKEIKAWEHAFKADNSRDANVEDIKAHPQIAEKYKLYKKYAKELAASKASQKAVDPPKTPPRRNVKLAESPALISKPRAFRSSMPSSSNNPFSPVKTPRKQMISPNDAPLGMPNFAATSSTEIASASPVPDPSHAGRAFSKARKRLRGDSVSPSPKKQPRIRAPLSGPTDSDEDLAFVADSPVKATTGGKDFVSLFNEDRLLAPQFNAKPVTESGASSQIKASSVFPSQVLQNGRSTKPMKQATGKLQKVMSSNDIFGEDSRAAPSKGESPRSADEGSEGLSRDRKRPSSCGSDRIPSESSFEHESTTSLLPPSPTQNEHKKSSKNMAKGFAKKRKKLSTLEIVGTNDDSLEDENIYVVEINPIPKARATTRQNSDEDEDRLLTDAFAPADEQVVYSSQTEPAHELEVSLPGELRDVLHISLSQTSEMKERALAESLLKGELLHPWQDDVWGAGEFDRAGLAASDDEEDWEGEGTPWEVGEM